MDAQAEEIQLMTNVAKFLDGKLVDEFIAQGHHLTGAFENSLHGTVLNTGIETHAIGSMADYGIFIQRGVGADRIPFNQGSGAGTSKYITALINYWMLRGLSEKEATRAAFATAKTHKKQGMPSYGSYAFSSTGERKSFITIVDEKVTPELNEMVSDGFDSIIDRLFHETPSETI